MSKISAKSARSGTFGAAAIASLQQFIDATERGKPMTARTVKVDLEPRSYDARAVKTLRASMNVSQAMFAKLLAVSVKTVQAWESGRVAPPSLACRLLDDIEIDPQVWMRRQVERGARAHEFRRKRAG